MMKRETLFVIDRELILVDAQVTGPRGPSTGRFVLDTGAVFTTITPELADLIGYSARDGVRRTRVRTAIGDEDGYVVHVAALSVLQFSMSAFPVHVFDLGHDDIDGLLGMNFLSELNYEVRSFERRILAEKASAPLPAG